MNGFVVGLGVLNLAALVAGWVLYRVWFVQPPPETDDSSMFVFAIEEEQRGLNLPPTWAKRLSSDRIRVKSIVEGGLQIVQLGLDSYMTELTDIVDKVQLAFDTGDDLELTNQARRIENLLDDRLPELQEITEEFERRKDKNTEHLACANQLAESLSDEVAEVSDAVRRVAQLNFARDAKEAGEQLIEEVRHVLEAAEELRRVTDDVLEEVLAISSREEETAAANAAAEAQTAELERVEA